MAPDGFLVGISADAGGADGRPLFDFDLLDEAAVPWEWMPGEGELEPADVAPYDALILFGRRVTEATLAGVERLRLVARLGVGVDSVDVDACTRAGVLVTITPDGVRRPMAAGAMAFVLALAHRLPEMDWHVRRGGWERFRHVGLGLEGRMLGIVGLGNVGRELATLAAPFGLRVIAADPFVGDTRLDVKLCTLDELLGASDFVAVTCPLTDDTRRLIGAAQLARMKPTAYLVNVARGPIVDETALVAALREGVIAGAALDVFDPEPLCADSALLSLENVILAPHAVGLTDEFCRLSGRSVSRAAIALRDGQLPEWAINPEASSAGALGF
ncbi:MAG: dehydrogenase [Thermoleophilia bacterium]|nr:dehydrogenase [Thermoleophilia bacterium]